MPTKKILELEVEGFGPYVSKQAFKFQAKRLHLISSDNGTGKTTLFNGIPFALYGKTLKSKSTIESYEHLRGPEYKGTRVKLTFMNGKKTIEVIRMVNYKGKEGGSTGGNRLILRVDGKAFAGKKIPTQKEIEKHIGYSFELFRNAIMFGQKLKRLIEETGPEKYSILEECLEQTYILKAREKADSDAKRLKEEINTLDKSLIRAEGKVNLVREELRSGKKLIAQFKELKEQSLELVKGKLESKRRQLVKLCTDYSTKFNELNQDLSKGAFGITKSNVEAKIEKIKQELFRLELNDSSVDLETTKQQLATYKEQYQKIPTKCPNCGGRLSQEKVMAERLRIKQYGEKLKASIPELEARIKAEKVRTNKLNKKLTTYNSIKSTLEKLANEILTLTATHRRSRRELEKEIATLEKELSKSQSKKPNVRLKTIRKELTRIKTEYKGIRVDIDQKQLELEAIQWVLKDALSNSGLKAYVISSQLDSLNQEIDKYIGNLGNWRVLFKVDLDSKSKSIYTEVIKDGYPVAYEDLSGGQAQLVNVCTAMGLNDLAIKNNPLSILFLDEVFESLDATNIELVTDLIKQKSVNQAIYLVTHRKEFTTRVASKTIIKYEHPGISTIQVYN